MPECDLCGSSGDLRAVGAGRVCAECESTYYDSSDGSDVREATSAIPAEDSAMSQENPRSEDPASCRVSFRESQKCSYPLSSLQVRLWLVWKYDEGTDRKIPRAPWVNPDWPDKFAANKNPENWTDHETARKWCTKDTGYQLAMYLPSPEYDEVLDEYDVDPEELPVHPNVGLIDCDDVRDPETGEVHPRAKEMLVDAYTYTDISPSGTGLHALGAFTLPDGVRSLHLDISNEQFPDAEIEVYPSKRYTTMSGERVRDLPEDIRACQETVEGWMDEFEVEREHSADEAYEPVKSREEIEGMFEADERESTGARETAPGNMQDIFDALHHTTLSDIWLYSTCTEDGRNRKSFDPSWETSKSGTRLGWTPDMGFIYRRGNVSLSPLQVVALEERIISDTSEYPTGDEFWDAVEALRERGARIPEYDPDLDPDYLQPKHHVHIPGFDGPDERVGWWASDDRGFARPSAEALTQQDVYARTETRLNRIFENEENAVLDGIMSSGKSFSSFKVARERDEPIAYFAGRGDLYEQGKEYAVECGFEFVPFEERESGHTGDIHIMPSMFRNCPTACGEHGQAVADRVSHLHSLGASPKMIHSMLDLPCEEGDSECPYFERTAIEPDNYEVIIGHYKHAHLPYLVSGRHCIVDENPAGAYTTQVDGDELVRAVNTFLGFEDSPPFDSFNDLIRNSDDEKLRRWTRRWYNEFEWEPDERNVVAYEDCGYHALAPYCVYAMVFGEPISEGNPRHRTSLPLPRTHAVYHESDDKSSHAVRINTPPNRSLNYARSVTALDGTPLTLPEDSPLASVKGRYPEWQMALGKRLNRRRILSDAERREFISETQEMNMVQTTDSIKPYTSGEYQNWSSDAALLEAARDTYGLGKPVCVTTKKVRSDYESRDEAGELVRDWNHFANLRGSNEYASNRLGVILGSPHHGDETMKMRAAMMGIAIEGSGKGVNRSYGNELGDGLLHEMRESAVAQAAMRFGRDGDGAIVLIHTSAIPDWLPLAGKGSVVTTWTDTQRTIMNVLLEGGSWTAAELAEHPDVSVGARQCLNVLSGLRDRGFCSDGKRDSDRRAVEWEDSALADAPVYGETDLPVAEILSVGPGEVDELGRIVSYTRDFVNSGGDTPVAESVVGLRRSAEDDPPPDGSANAD